MFTGIITHTGNVTKIDLNNNKLYIENKFKNINIGTSVSVDGACLTVSDYDYRSITFALSEETLKSTIISNYNNETVVNLELPVTNETLFSGHIVLGHVDDIGKVNKIEIVKENTWDFYFTTPNETYIVNKGSISINGISLTTNLLSNNLFYVSVIAETFNNTNLNSLNENAEVNIEYDIIGKYVHKLSK